MRSNLPVFIILVKSDPVFWNACPLPSSRPLFLALVCLVTLFLAFAFKLTRTVSENKPVGSVAPGKDADLLGDEIASTPTPNGAPAVPATQDLLAEIFGSSAASPPSSTGSAAPAAPQRNIAQDILGLFDSPAAPSSAPSPPQPAAPAPLMQSIFGATAVIPQATSPPPAAGPTGYSAYDKNELRITLTPQTSATRPGLVRVIANFQATGANAVSELNFQAAVPKVRAHLLSRPAKDY